MVVFTVAEAAAAQAAGTNLMSGNRFQFDSRPRVVTQIGVTGSTNPGNASVDLFYGNTIIGTFSVTTSGANVLPLQAKDFIPVTSNQALLPNEPLNILTHTPSTTNAMQVTVVIQEL